MPTPGEQRALIFLAAVAALGVAARGWQSHKAANAPLVAGDAAGLARQIEAVDSAIASGGARRGRGRGAPPLSLAKVAPQTERATPSAARAAPLQLLAAAPAAPEPPDNRARYLARWARADSLRDAINSRQARPTSQSSQTAARVARSAVSAPVDLDVASVEEIGAVPAIGSALARRIVADRIEHGPFGSANELQRVRGLSPALARRLSPYVTFSRAPVTSGRVEEATKVSAPRRRRKQP